MHFRYRAIACLALLVWAGMNRPAVAAETAAAGESADQLQEIVVTAEKRSENLQKAPATVSVVTGDDLVTRGIGDISEATVMFPSVKFGQISGTTHMYIRGIGAEQD